MFERRDVLKIAVGGLAAAKSVASAQAAPGWFSTAQAQTPNSAPPQPFSHSQVQDLARALAKKPFRAPANDLPDPFSGLNYEQYVGIRTKPEAFVWANENLGFAIEPLHRGFIFSSPMQLFTVTDGQPQRLGYEPKQFDFGKLNVPEKMADIGFSGFRILAPKDNGGLGEIGIFQGASFFRAIAKQQTMGSTARGLAIRTADPKGEDFPIFRAIWIEKPSLAGNALTIHALLDSETVTGAYRFTLRPGEATIIDTECTLIPRVALDHFGLGTMSGTYLFGAIDRRRSDDLRPEVHEVSGLQMYTGSGEWLWRPVANRETLQISSFVDERPRGFGFLQREREFERYQDDDQHWEMRPSLWIEPIGDWGRGAVQLVEIPSDSEVNDNIIAYWRPAQALQPNVEAQFAYRQFWCWTPPERPALAIAATSRSGRGSAPKRRRFVVDFFGDIFADPTRNTDIKPVLTTNPGTTSGMRSFLSKDRKSFRVYFEIDPGADNYCEMRLVLEAAGKPVSETWLYRWTS